MKLEIIYDNFNAPLSDLIDKTLYDIRKIEGSENSWVVSKREKSVGTFTISNGTTYMPKDIATNLSKAEDIIIDENGNRVK